MSERGLGENLLSNSSLIQFNTSSLESTNSSSQYETSRSNSFSFPEEPIYNDIQSVPSWTYTTTNENDTNAFNSGLKVVYTNADSLLSKRDEL